METLFGIPMPTLMLGLLAALAVVLGIIGLIAWRNGVIFNLGVRNIPRRRAQTALIVAGLTLSTIIITSALATGDTLAYSIRSQGVQQWGLVDERVVGTAAGPQAAPRLSQAEYDDLVGKLQSDPDIDGLAPLFQRTVAVVAPASGQGEPALGVLATDARWDAGFGGFRDQNAAVITVASLGANEVLMSESAATALQATAGAALNLFVGTQPTTVTVKAIVRDEGRVFADARVLIMPLATAQTLWNAPGELTALAISNRGDVYEGVKTSDAVTRRVRLLVTKPEVAERIRQVLVRDVARTALDIGITKLEAEAPPRVRLLRQAQSLRTERDTVPASDALRVLLADGEFAGWLGSLSDLPSAEKTALNADVAALATLQVNDDKARALAAAEEQGNTFFSLFLIVGSFSIMAGMLLIFLIFVMLAAERRGELGMARAVGLQRRHLIQSFVSEGTIYDLLAAAVGVGLGFVVSWLMVQVLASGFAAFGDTEYSLVIRFNTTPYSLVIAFCLGMLLTFATVAFASWRVSRLNIVAAIRDLPDLDVQPSLWVRLWRLARGLLLIALGVATQLSGYPTKQNLFVFMGVALWLVGGGLVVAWLLHRTPLRRAVVDRLVYSLLGTALIGLWMLPQRWFGLLQTEGFATNSSFFIFAGLFAVLGGVWVIIYNGDTLLAIVMRLLGGFGSFTPVLKVATAYALVSKFRTGMTLAMFGLIIFILVALSTILTVNSALLDDVDGITGGYNLVATVGGANRIGDLRQAAQGKAGLDASALSEVVAASRAPLELREVGAANQSWTLYPVTAAAPAYFQTVANNYNVTPTASFPNAAAVWQALAERDDVVLLQRVNVRWRSAQKNAPPPYFEVEQGYIEDTVLPDYTLEMRIPGTERVRQVKVAGVLQGVLTLPFASMITNDATAQALAGTALPPSLYVIKLAAGSDQTAVAQQLEKAFLTDGLNVTDLDETVVNVQRGSSAFNGLFKGFLALGLLVGIAALGVISSRSVVERRQQIGMLRAIGYQGRMVQLSFMIESSFVALLGIILGTGLGLLLGASVVQDFARQLPGLEFKPPWGELAIIAIGSYAASLVATYLPARRAARIYPAEALRYE